MKKPIKTPKEWTEGRITELLKKRYSGNAWACIPKVRNGTGWARTPRTADAIAMSLWPSRGLHLYGFEIKVERADWVRELNDPEKAEDIFGFCDFWYIVAPAGIVNLGEVPKTWGLLEAGGRGLTATIDAPKLTPKPIDSAFLAALLRKVSENMVAETQLTQARAEGHAEGVEAGKKASAYLIECAESKQKKAEERVSTFEQMTGLSFDSWRPTAEVAAAVRAVRNGEDKHILTRLGRIRSQIQELLEHCDRSIAAKPLQES